MKKILTSNGLKIVAIITMLIDHIGYYLYPILNAETYYLFRNIGRIAMPLFAFLIVQGFFHTKNLKKYITRIFGLAIITQICLSILNYINTHYFPNYITGINNYLNILFSYGLSLILLALLDKKQITKKYSKIPIFILVFSLYLLFNFDYGMRIPFIVISMYYIEKLLQNEKIKRFKYLLLLLFIFILSLTFVQNGTICKYSMLISLVFIAFYNGQNGKKSKFTQYLFYAFFPIHHVILYLIAMFL